MATSSVNRRLDDRQPPLLVVAALARELAPLGRDARGGIALIETGEGVRNAERAVRSWLERRDARAVLGIGFAGALSSSLRVGDCVIARDVRGAGHAGESFASSSALLSAAEQVRIDGLRFGTAITVDEIVGKAVEKRRLAALLAQDEIGCLDMESSAIARVCSERGVPFLVARTITDLLDEDLPMRPQSLKGLIELKRRSEACAENLASFVLQMLRLTS
jgi:nucleoside phosphorylase